jgi:hypothetical protein
MGWERTVPIDGGQQLKTAVMARFGARTVLSGSAVLSTKLVEYLVEPTHPESFKEIRK